MSSFNAQKISRCETYLLYVEAPRIFYNEENGRFSVASFEEVTIDLRPIFFVPLKKHFFLFAKIILDQDLCNYAMI